ncbi:putative chromatin remodeler Bromodomain family [Helianthus annuus]|nr:putative chromatin remodeler Bromodomain family [Helianthus annuus]
MDSGTLDADKIRKEKSKWGDYNKVYTRRRKRVINHASAAVSAAVAPVTVSPATASPATVAVASPVTEAAVGSPVNTTNNDQTLTLANDVSNDFSGRSPREEPMVPVVAGNGVVRPGPIATLVDDRVRIRLEASTSKDDIKELREKLELELDQVRSLVQRLEDKETEISHYSNAIEIADNDNDNDGGYDQLQYHSGNVTVDRRSLVRVNSEMGMGMGTDYMDRRGLTRVYSEIGSDMVDRRALMRVGSEVSPFENHDMSRFRQLSVSVGEYVEKEKRTPKANQYYRGSDFLLGKDRLPLESNKKLKSNGGRKSDYSVGLERHKNQVFRSCSSLLQRLMKHKHGWVFNEPVNAKLLGLHDYHDIIKHPMDLGTIKSRLAQNFYKTPGEFAEDIRLTFHNAMTYNPKGQDVHVMAEQLSDIFEEKWVVIESDWRYGPVNDSPVARKVNNPRTLDRSQSMGLPFMARPKPPSFAPVSRTPAPKKPKAKDPNKRDMTFEEKQKLSANLQSLPSEKLDSIVQIINRSNTSLSQNDDEIEVDIDSVDAETLWELDRFVMNYRKNLSKHRRKAEKARALAGNTNQAMLQNPAASVPVAPPETRADEQNRAASPPNQGGDNASSSSSSSSDSGSSSSDSDSDSSSGSDAGQ